MIKTKIATLVLLASFFVNIPLHAKEIALNPDHPEQYVVQKGDTLWDISNMFLRDPWLWPEIWHVNTQIANPHLIFPGDLLKLVYIDGKPQIMVERGKTGLDQKLSPKTRVISLEDAIPTIPLSAIQQFLSKPRVVDNKTLDDAPKVVAIEEKRVIAGLHDKIYATGLTNKSIKGYSLFRKGRPYIDPDTKAQLGFEAIYLGEAKVLDFDSTSTLNITASTRETLKRDRLLPAEERELLPYYSPHAPKSDVNGKIMSVFDGLTQIGQFQIITINVGSNKGIDDGTILGIYRKGETIKDDNQEITLPDQKSGELMVFRTYPLMSIAIVMKANRDMSTRDIIKNP